MKGDKMTLTFFDFDFTICKVKDLSAVNFGNRFTFFAATDEELSLVCPAGFVPDETTERDEGWRCFKINGVLDFSLIGILSKISGILAAENIGIFAVSTYNTDYILVKKENYKKTIDALKSRGYELEFSGEEALL